VPKEKWIQFWIDPMSFYMMVRSREDWEEAVKKINGGANRLLKMKHNFGSSFPDFGEGFKYKSSPTLGEWAEQNGIKLT